MDVWSKERFLWNGKEVRRLYVASAPLVLDYAELMDASRNLAVFEGRVNINPFEKIYSGNFFLDVHQFQVWEQRNSKFQKIRTTLMFHAPAWPPVLNAIPE